MIFGIYTSYSIWHFAESDDDDEDPDPLVEVVVTFRFRFDGFDFRPLSSEINKIEFEIK